MTTPLPFNLLTILVPTDSPQVFRGMDIGSNKNLAPGIHAVKGS